MALGCDGINMGTAFVATQESMVHENVKQAIVDMDETQTKLIFRSYKNTARVYANAIADKVLQVEQEGGDFSEVHEYVKGANQDIAWTTGDLDAGMLMVGISGGLINEIPTYEQLVSGIVSDAKKIISQRLASMIES